MRALLAQSAAMQQKALGEMDREHETSALPAKSLAFPREFPRPEVSKARRVLDTSKGAAAITPPYSSQKIANYDRTVRGKIVRGKVLIDG